MKPSVPILAVLTVLLTILPVYSYDSQGIELIGTPYNNWGSVNDVQVVGDLAYLTDGYGLRVVDVSNPALPSEIGWCWVEKGASTISILENTAFTANLDSTISIIDLSNPQRPLEITNFRLETSIRHFTVNLNHPDYLYVYSDSELEVVDISDIMNPRIVSQLPVQWGWRILYADNKVFLSTERGIEIFDVSNPDSPARLGIFNGSNTRDVVVQDTLLFTTDRSNLYTVNISDPTNPVRIGMYRTPSQMRRIAVQDDVVVLCSGEGTIETIDVSNPTSPRRIDQVDCFYENGVYNLFLSGNHIYLATGDSLTLFSITDPADIIPVSSIAHRDDPYSYQILNDDHFTYLFSDKGFKVLDMTNPLRPIQVGQSDIYFELWNEHNLSQQCGHRIYWQWEEVEDEVDMGSDIVVKYIDVSVPNEPEQKELTFDAEGYDEPTNLYRKFSHFLLPNYNPDIVYVIHFLGNDMDIGYFRLQAYDISDPDNLQFLDTLLFESTSYGFVAFQDKLFGFNSYHSEIAVIDVSNPENIFIEEVVEAQVPRFFKCYLSSRHILLTGTDVNGNISIVTMFNPENLEFTGPFEFPNALISNIKISDSLAYLAYDFDALRVFNLNDNFREIGWFNTPGECHDVAIDGPYAYVADGWNLGIYDCSRMLGLGVKHPNVILHPSAFILSTYPNPFNSSTTIEYRVGSNSNSTTLSLYDLSGRLVQTLVEGRLTPGNYRTTLNANNLAAGVYVVRLDPPPPPLGKGGVQQESGSGEIKSHETKIDIINSRKP